MHIMYVDDERPALENFKFSIEKLDKFRNQLERLLFISRFLSPFLLLFLRISHRKRKRKRQTRA